MAHMLNTNQQRYAAMKKKTYKQNPISKTFEVIPLLCSVIVRLQLEYFVQFCVLLSKIGGGLAEKHIQESTNSDLKSGNHDL